MKRAVTQRIPNHLLTSWFPEHIKPVRPGYYEIKGAVSTFRIHNPFKFWSGEAWHHDAGDVKCWQQCVEWRGLISDYTRKYKKSTGAS